MHNRQVVALCVALAFLATGVAFAQRNNQPQQPKRSKTEQADIDTLVKVVDDVAAGQAAPTDVPLKWGYQHYLRQADGTTVFPFVVDVDGAGLPSKDVSVYVRVVDKAPPADPAPAPEAPANQRDNRQQQPPPRPQYPWENIYFVSVPNDGKLQRAIALKAGEYELFIAVKDRLKNEKSKDQPKIGVLRQSLTVPDFNAGLTTSDVIVAKSLEQLSAPLSQKDALEQPYVFGTLRVGPALDPVKLSKAEELSVLFWVYGAGNAETGKPDLSIEYNFNQKTAEGEKFFNRTQPVVRNAQTLEPEFNPAIHVITEVQQVPLASFPEGDYRLEIKVTDKTNNTSVTKNINFTVTAS